MMLQLISYLLLKCQPYSEYYAATLLTTTMGVFKVIPFVRFYEIHISNPRLIISNVVGEGYFVRFGLSARYNSARAIGSHGRPRTSPALDYRHPRLLGVIIHIELIEICLFIEFLAVPYYLRF